MIFGLTVLRTFFILCCSSLAFAIFWFFFKYLSTIWDRQTVQL